MLEEDLKVHVIYPLLRDLGIDSAEISFETSFRIQLGRGVFTVGGEEVGKATGRSDVLCLRNNKALMVVEVKGDNVSLTDADRLQGLSYARLLDPMAPLVLVTNGRDTRVFGTISGNELDPKKQRLDLDGLC